MTTNCCLISPTGVVRWALSHGGRVMGDYTPEINEECLFYWIGEESKRCQVLATFEGYYWLLVDGFTPITVHQLNVGFLPL